MIDLIMIGIGLFMLIFSALQIITTLPVLHAGGRLTNPSRDIAIHSAIIVIGLLWLHAGGLI